jgi:hypothetical protein
VWAGAFPDVPTPTVAARHLLSFANAVGVSFEMGVE